MLDATVITCSILKPARDLYESVWRPERFPLWASGLSDTSLRQIGDEVWVAPGQDGPIRITFTGHNGFGVMDHWVDLGEGRIVYVPLRIVANGEGSHVSLTLFRQPWMSDAQFAEDEASVRQDLARLQTLAEAE